MKSLLATIFLSIAFFMLYQFADPNIFPREAMQASIFDFFSTFFDKETEPTPISPVPAPVFVNEKPSSQNPSSAPVVEVSAPIGSIDLRKEILDILNSELVYSRLGSPSGERGPAGPRGATGVPGPMGPQGPAGPSASSVDTSNFVTWTSFDKQIDRMLDTGASESQVEGLEDSLAEEVTTHSLSLTGSTSGEITINPAATAGTYMLTLPTDDGDSGEMLTTDGAGVLSWTAPVSSQWTTVGSDIYYTSGNVGIGDSTPTAMLDVNSTTSGAATDDTAMRLTFANSAGYTAATSTDTAFLLDYDLSGSAGGIGGRTQHAPALDIDIDNTSSVGSAKSQYVYGLRINNNFSGSSSSPSEHQLFGEEINVLGDLDSSNTSHIGSQIIVSGAAATNKGMIINVTGATNNYGIYITGPAAAAGNYALYSIATAQSYLNGTLKIGGTLFRDTTEGTNHLDIFDGTAPVGTLANGVSLYSTAGELRVMDAAGNATLLSPHENEHNYWVFDSANAETGKTLVIDMELIIKDLNDSLDLDYVHETQDGESVDRGEGTILAKIFEKVAVWLGEAGNGISRIFTNEIETQNLCVADASGEKTCITKAELDQLLLNAGQTNMINSGENNEVAEDPVSPVEGGSAETPADEPAEESFTETPTSSMGGGGAETEEPVVETPAVVEESAPTSSGEDPVQVAPETIVQ